jgi:hypothetical protein
VSRKTEDLAHLAPALMSEKVEQPDQSQIVYSAFAQNRTAL